MELCVGLTCCGVDLFMVLMTMLLGEDIVIIGLTDIIFSVIRWSFVRSFAPLRCDLCMDFGSFTIDVMGSNYTSPPPKQRVRDSYVTCVIASVRTVMVSEPVTTLAECIMLSYAAIRTYKLIFSLYASHTSRHNSPAVLSHPGAHCPAASYDAIRLASHF